MAEGNGLALAAVGLGGIFVWSSLNNKTILSSAQSLIQGKKPTPGPNAALTVSIPPTAGGGTGTTTLGSGPLSSESAIASDGETYAGKVPYLWGGYTTKGWDCSGFVNYVLGHDLSYPIPGHANGSYEGHGPVAAQYYAWTTMPSVAFADAQPGDIVAWLTHVGIVTGPDQMVSALDPQYGTAITPIKGYGPTGEPMIVRRLRAYSVTPTG